MMIKKVFLFVLSAVIVYNCSQAVFATSPAPTEKRVLTVESPPVPNLPKTTTKVIKKLVLNSNRVVKIVGEIGEQSLNAANKIIELGQSDEPIYILINSPGGSVIDGASIISAIEASKAPVHTICVQLCASMAAVIFEYGTERMMVDRSFVMFHPASAGARDEVDKMVSRLTTIQRYVGKMDAHIAKRSGVGLEKYKSLTSSELWLDAEDALATGFSDSIVSIMVDGETSPVFIMLPPSNTSKEEEPDKKRLDLQWN